MDYGYILTRAWQITWRWKILWIMGFLAALSQSGSWNPLNYSVGDTDLTTWGEWGTWHIPGPWDTWSPGEWMGAVWTILAAACALSLLLAIIVWIVSTVARGGLIAGVQQAEDEGSTSFGRAWRPAWRRIWTLLGIWLLTLLPVLVVIAGTIAIVLLIVLGAGAGSQISDAAAGFGALGPLLLCGIPLCCGTFLLILVLDVLRKYAERAAIIDGLGWIDAIKRGWETIRRHLGPTIVFWLINLAIGLVVAVAVGILAAVVVLPLGALFMGTEGAGWTILPICGVGLLGFILLVLLSSALTTFESAMWTLAYRAMTRESPAAGPLPVAPAE